MSNTNLIKVYELDFGDTNLIDKDIQTLLDWIKIDLQGMSDSDEVCYTITTQLMTKEQFESLPEWN